MPRYLLLICILLAACPTARAGDGRTVYKWVDDAGETHYTQMPPQQRQYDVVRGAAPPADNPQQIRQDLQKDVQAMDKAQQKRADKKMDADQWHEIQTIRRKNCATARQNLAKLHQGGEKRYLTQDGQVVHLTEDERQRRIDEANKQIEENCD